MAEFMFTGIPEGYEPIDKDLNKSIRKVCFEEFYFYDGCVYRWTYKHPSDNTFLILKKIEKPKKYRAFNNAEEAEAFFNVVLKPKNSRFGEKCDRHRINLITATRAWIAGQYFTYAEAFYIFECVDGTPFGVEVIE